MHGWNLGFWVCGWRVDGTDQRLFPAVGFIVGSVVKRFCFTTRELVTSVEKYVIHIFDTLVIAALY